MHIQIALPVTLARGLAAAALLSPLGALAIAPGLWEHTMTTQAAGGATGSQMAGLQAQLASMPPEQRKQMEAMMASKGVAMGAAPGAVRMCISPEQAAGGQLRKPDPGCTQQMGERSATRMRMSFECAGPPPSKGDIDYSFSGEKAYTGTMRITHGSGAQARTATTQVTGRWLAADCGALKPAAETAKPR
jgi:hypothetical protein